MAARSSGGQGEGRRGARGEGILEVLRAMRASTPVNKGTSPRLEGGRRLPQIDNPLIVGAVGLGVAGLGVAARTLHPKGRRGRDERFRQRLAESLTRAPGDGVDLAPEDLSVAVEQSFGRPALVSVDVRVDGEWIERTTGVRGRSSSERPASGEDDGVDGGDGGDDLAGRVLDDVVLSDLLDRIARAAWDNPEVAPVAVRGRVTLVEDAAEPRVLADMTLLGFPDEIARPGDLYDRYGAPAFDPAWRP